MLPVHASRVGLIKAHVSAVATEDVHKAVTSWLR